MESGDPGYEKFYIKEKNKETDRYRSYTDTEMQSGRQYWTYNDSPLEHFEASFEDVFPEKINNFGDYIDRLYPNKKGELIGIELGGPGIQLFKSLNQSRFKHTAGFTLNTPPYQREGGLKNHDVIEADIFHTRLNNEHNELDGYQKVREWVKQHGRPDLIIERMARGIQHKGDSYLLKVLNRWYRLLSQDGTAFVELPFGYFTSQKAITDFLNSHKNLFDYQINVREEHGDDKGRHAGTFIRLRKLPDAPDSLVELLKTEVTSEDVHNPDHLTTMQIGIDKGWRLLRIDELGSLHNIDKMREKKPPIQKWSGEEWIFVDFDNDLDHNHTYRVQSEFK